jgi:hypothetical protein
MEKACHALIGRYLEGQALDRRVPLPPEVEALFEANCVAQATLPGSTITAADLEACAASPLAQQTALPCLDYGGSELFPAHDHVGMLAMGAACHAGLQCASGRCSGNFETCGICQETRQAGEPCEEPKTACPEWLFCNAGFCGSLGTSQGEHCNAYGGGDCRTDLYCQPFNDQGLDGSCQPRGAIGSACSNDHPCLDSLYCQSGACAARLADGESCDQGVGCLNYCHDGVCASQRHDAPVGADCSFDQCDAGLVCSEQSVCVALPFAHEGEPCGLAGCALGLICDSFNESSPTRGLCLAAPKIGEVCVNFECDPLGYCDHETVQWGVCKARGFAGEPAPCVGPLFWGQDDLCHPAQTACH